MGSKDRYEHSAKQLYVRLLTSKVNKEGRAEDGLCSQPECGVASGWLDGLYRFIALQREQAAFADHSWE